MRSSARPSRPPWPWGPPPCRSWAIAPTGPIAPPAIFRRHDRRSFEELRPVWGQEEAYILASRDAAQTMDKLLSADLARLRPGDGVGAWDTASLDEELKERAEREAARREEAK